MDHHVYLWQVVVSSLSALIYIWLSTIFGFKHKKRLRISSTDQAVLNIQYHLVQQDHFKFSHKHSNLRLSILTVRC